MIKTLILGGAGFIGSNLAEYLTDHHHKVCVFDRQGVQIENLRKKGIRIECGDFRDPSIYRSLLHEHDNIIDLVGLSGAVNSIQQLHKYNELNITSQLLFLESLASMSQPKRLVFASSRLVYGEVSTNPVSEHCNAQPKDFYGIQKKTIEDFIRVFCNLKENLSAIVLRITNPYGLSVNDYMYAGYNFFNNTYRKIKNCEPVKIFGKGSQLRDYIYVADLVEGIRHVIETAPNGFSLFNMGSGHGVSIISAIEEIARLMNRDLKVEYVPWPDESAKIETGDFVANITKLKALGWQPRYQIREGVTDMIEKEERQC